MNVVTVYLGRPKGEDDSACAICVRLNTQVETNQKKSYKHTMVRRQQPLEQRKSIPGLRGFLKSAYMIEKLDCQVFDAYKQC